jgi:predicted dehydrogenase
MTAARFNVPTHYARIEDMLAADEIDLAIIATPIPFHFDNALAAVRAGKHVYVQKTMTETRAQADALLAARDEMRVKLAAAPGFELFPLVPEMRELVQGGTLGPVYLAFTYTIGFAHERETIRLGQGALAAIDPTWYYRAGAGPVPDVTVYALQLATTVLGPVTRVTALGNKRVPSREWQGQTIPIQVNDNNAILLEFESGTLGTAVGSDCAGGARIPWGGLGVYGRAGSLEVKTVDWTSGYPIAFQVNGGVWNGASAAPDAVREFSRPVTDQPYLQGEHLELDEPHVYADIMDLADAIVEGRAPRASGEQARHIVEIVEQALKAQETGKAQTVQSRFENPSSIG